MTRLDLLILEAIRRDGPMGITSIAMVVDERTSKVEDRLMRLMNAARVERTTDGWALVREHEDDAA